MIYPRPLIEVAEEKRDAFRRWLEKECAELPDALPAKIAASLIGCQLQRIYELIKENVLHGIKIGAVRYIPKTKFISYAASPEILSKPTSDTYRELIQEFKKRR